MCCLLSFVEISCLALTEELPSYGEAWNMFLDAEQTLFIIGFQEGVAMSLAKLTPIDPSADTVERNIWIELFDLYLFMKEHRGAIVKVVGDLYKDPANTYIFCRTIIEIACQKLKGEDIEPLLQEARREALP